MLNASNELIDVLKSNEFFRKNNERRYEKLDFKDLMTFRVNNILLVCSLYDYYSIVEDGHLQEALFNEYLEMNLYYAPHIIRANSAENALKMLDKGEYDLIITTLRLGDQAIEEFTSIVKEKYPEIPMVLLASQSRELQLLIESDKLNSLDKIFIWTGDRKIFLAIVKHVEDIKNAPIDCLQFGVTSILLVEDSPLFYSSYLPLIYTEVMNQTQKLIEEGKSTAEKLMRQRARPKILHAETYEEAMELFEKYRGSLLGIISDLKFSMNGEMNENAGYELIKKVKKKIPLLPLLLQSSEKNGKNLGDQNGVSFLDKNSRTLLLELREFMQNNFGFGDFVFRLPDGTELLRARNLRDLRDKLKFLPSESLLYHSQNNHFSLWLIARTEFEIAYKIRPIKISQFSDATELRKYLINVISDHLKSIHRGSIAVFTRGDYDAERVFQMIGEGSLGGKARGLAFVDSILNEYIPDDFFKDVRISVPRTIVLGTDVFSQFMEMNDLYPTVVEDISDEQMLRYFLRADLPATVIGDIREILKKAKFPIAVRSSSLLEDAMYQPFAGVYATVMIPNSSKDFEVRFHNLIQAIKFVYASTYSKNAKNYIEATGNRLEEEKMGLIIQEVAGRKYGDYFYPSFSGVARSYNYYPFGKAEPKDGIVNLALGLGRTIVDGGVSLQYSPAYPSVFPQFANRKDLFSKSQIKYFAINLKSDRIVRIPSEDSYLSELHISEADKHGTLRHIASTYSPENDYLYEGTTRSGPRVLDFAPILKSNVIPLNDILKLLLKMTEVAMNCPVEIEFAVTMGEENPTPVDFRFLQVRPMVKHDTVVEVDLINVKDEEVLLKTEMALGNGNYSMNTVLFVKPESFDKSKTTLIGTQINEINKKLLSENTSYMLIGPGRWGSSDPWLGIPVEFSAISSALVIVEMALPDMIVDPSQGSHFFQNMTSFKIAYLTLRNLDKQEVDWDWLNSMETMHETEYIKLVRLKDMLDIRIDGKLSKAIVLKK